MWAPLGSFLLHMTVGFKLHFIQFLHEGQSREVVIGKVMCVWSWAVGRGMQTVVWGLLEVRAEKWTIHLPWPSQDPKIHGRHTIRAWRVLLCGGECNRSWNHGCADRSQRVHYSEGQQQRELMALYRRQSWSLWLLLVLEGYANSGCSDVYSGIALCHWQNKKRKSPRFNQQLFWQKHPVTGTGSNCGQCSTLGNRTGE